MKKLLALALLLCGHAVLAQDRTRLHQLQAELTRHAENDSAKVDLLIRISGQHAALRTDSANYFLHEALSIAKKMHFLKGEARTYAQLASRFPNNIDSAHFYLRSAVDAAKRAGDTGTLGHAYLSLSYAVLTGTYRLTTSRAAVNANAGAYADSAAATFQAMRDTAWWINGLTRQAGIFMDHDSMPQAGAALRKARSIQSASSVKGEPVATLYFTKGDYHFIVGEFDSALVCHQNAIPILEEHSPQGVAYAYGLIARDHAKLRQFDLAIENAEHALRIAEENGLVKEKLDALTALCQVYREKGDLTKALSYYEWLYRESDSLNTARLKEITSKFDVQMEAQRSREKVTVLLKDQQLQEQRAARQRLTVFALSGGLLLIIALATSIYKGKKRSDELLHNILPEEVAAELKKKGHADAKHFDEATILFTDFKGFTQASEQMSPQDLVEELNTCFKAFDRIITARGIEKIKTIGDAYMCAGGLPAHSSSTPAGVVQAALEMQTFMAQRKAERDTQGKPAFEMRVGIHTGPVVAGIVGVKKFQYDIWGDTVNTASRMESSGEVGQVNISEATYALVKNEPGLSFTPRGKVKAKGKGEMEMYFVN